MANVRTPGQPSAPEQRSEKTQLRVTPSESAAWKDDARHHDIQLSTWMRRHLDLAAKSRNPAIAPITLKNLWELRTLLHQVEDIVSRRTMSDGVRELLQQRVELMRGPLAFLVELHIEELRAS